MKTNTANILKGLLAAAVWLGPAARAGAFWTDGGQVSGALEQLGLSIEAGGGAAGQPAAAPDMPENIPGPDMDPPRFYGADSRQARLEFTSSVLYKVLYTTHDGPLLSSSLRRDVSEAVDKQLRHMYGAFSTHPEFTENPGIPSGDGKVTLLGEEKVPGGPYVRITYSYSDTVVFAKGRFSGEATPLKFVLPKDPWTIYEKGFSAWSLSSKNLCTDGHYNSEGDFWYFWNPYKSGCPIKAADLVEVEASLTPLEETKNTYPEYAKLYGWNGGGDELLVTYLVGIDKTFDESDNGNKTFRTAFAGLKAAGFQATLDEPRRKKLSFNAGGKSTSLEMLLLDPRGWEFAREAVRGMNTADVFLYDGHSGLGGFLSVERLASGAGTLAPPLNKYQIFAFQGCSTYAYYNSAYFRLKRSDADPKGTKNLDIITTGIGAAFSKGAAVDVAFLTSVTKGERPSWQTIMDRMSAAEGRDTALSHVNGDEDNPNTPQ